MTARAVARLLPPGARIERRDPLRRHATSSRCSGGALRDYRGEVAMVFQDPRAHINPVRTIGDFMTEALRTAAAASTRREARRRAVQVLDDVGIEDGERRLGQYPHELSGGMLQRVMIAAVLLTEPRLILADEPTTALDVTTQAEVMAILDELRRERGMALLFITHDLELAGAVCDRTSVMYAGAVVETRERAQLHDDPLHPYTRGAGRRAADDRRDRCTAWPRFPARPVIGLRGAGGLPVRAALRVRAGPLPRRRDPGLRPLDGGLVRCVRAEELRGRLAAEVARHG